MAQCLSVGLKIKRSQDLATPLVLCNSMKFHSHCLVMVNTNEIVLEGPPLVDLDVIQ